MKKKENTYLYNALMTHGLKTNLTFRNASLSGKKNLFPLGVEYLIY